MTADNLPPQHVPLATISIVDVFAKQVEMGTQLAVIQRDLQALPDHETRLRLLETTRAKLVGGCLALSALAGAGAGWLALAVTHR